jgi:hypothetical protein
MTDADPMKLLTDIVFGKTVPSESWQEYERNQAKEAEYYHIKYGQAKGNTDEGQV